MLHVKFPTFKNFIRIESEDSTICPNLITLGKCWDFFKEVNNF